MEKIKKIISCAVPILCITTSVLVMLYLYQYIRNEWVVLVMAAFAFIVSILNLLIVRKTQKKDKSHNAES